MNYFFKKCVREGEERKTHGGKKVKKKELFLKIEDGLCLFSELETKEKEKLKMLERKHN